MVSIYMNEHEPPERSVFSSKFDVKTDKIRERIDNAPPIPKVKKTRTQSVLTALPVLMLMAGLLYHWHTERQQTLSKPIVAAQETWQGVFDRITPRDDKVTGKHFYWVRIGERTRPVRVTYEQKVRLQAESVPPGSAVELIVAPTVEGSSVMWLVSASVSQ